jgi:hypothetical protein
VAGEEGGVSGKHLSHNLLSLVERRLSGRKQHYIPKFLLRAFGRRGKGKTIQITVYSKKRGVFTTSLEGAAAERDFYSAPMRIRAIMR